MVCALEHVQARPAVQLHVGDTVSELDADDFESRPYVCGPPSKRRRGSTTALRSHRWDCRP